MKELRDIAADVIPLVTRAGAMARKAFGVSPVAITKRGGDLATAVDLQVNALIVSALCKQFPRWGIISEETKAIKPGADYTWILDPIDGSKHYALGIPFYGISLALRHREDLLVGVVYAPHTRELFHAARGLGAFRNGRRISCGRVADDLAKAIVCVELPSRHGGVRKLDRALARLRALMLACQRVRVIGVTSLGMCYCATGAFGAYVNLGSSPHAVWDWAGGACILHEAGGVVSARHGVTVAGNPAVHDGLRRLIR